MDYALDIFEKGGPVMWPLLACSLVSLTITLERMIFWLRERGRDNESLVLTTLDLVENGSSEVAIKNCSAVGNYISRVIQEGLQHREHGIGDVMQMSAVREVERMKKGLPVLDTVVTMAPLLGILGTVIGIIDSFNLLSVSGIEDPRAVTGGIAQALITTAAGLTIALLTLIPYNCFVSKVQAAAKMLETMGTELEILCRKSDAT
jgi:biopolymer transport protein ExbB